MSFTSLSADFISELNRKAFESIVIEKAWIGGHEAKTLLGLEEAASDAPFHFTYGGKRYWMKNSVTNRSISMEAVRFLMSLISMGRWAMNGETMIFSDTQMCISAQHRLAAEYLCSLSNPTIKLPVILVKNVPNEFADTADTGRSRSNTDILSRNADDIFDDVEITNLLGATFGDSLQSVKKTLCREMGGGCRLLDLRGKGKDVDGNGKFRQTELFSMLNRCPELPKLIHLVYVHDRGVAGEASFSKTWSIAQVATAIVLASNVDNSPESDILSVDFNLATNLCKSLANMQADSPFASVYAEMNPYTKRNAPKRLSRPHKFGALVKAILAFIESDCTVVNCKVIPQAKDMKDKKYPHFGGFDQGYVAPVRGKKKAEETEDETEE